MTSEATKAAKARYDAKTAKYISLKLNVNTDAALIEHLSDQENVQGYIKSLIRAAILNHPKEYGPVRISDKSYGCGICGHQFEQGRPHYCSNCGQAVKWPAGNGGKK